MGVLACDREGCTNVMCDRMSRAHDAYICDECFDELVDSGPETNVHMFMKTPKASLSQMDRREIALARFESEFPRRDGL